MFYKVCCQILCSCITVNIYLSNILQTRRNVSPITNDLDYLEVHLNLNHSADHIGLMDPQTILTNHSLRQNLFKAVFDYDERVNAFREFVRLFQF